jgi:hypothetical protein
MVVENALATTREASSTAGLRVSSALDDPG